MKIDEMTIGEVRQIASLFEAKKSSGSHSFRVGKAYLIRATYHHIGRITTITDTDIVLTCGGWLADSGRFAECLATGQLNEFEVAPAGMEWIVSRADIIDAWPWNHTLPTETK